MPLRSSLLACRATGAAPHECGSRARAGRRESGVVSLKALSNMLSAAECGMADPQGHPGLAALVGSLALALRVAAQRQRAPARHGAPRNHGPIDADPPRRLSLARA